MVVTGSSDLNSITQWSNGDYPQASNKEDDVAILARKLSVEVDEAGDTIITAAQLSLVGGNGTTSGIIATRQDVDVYEVEVAGAGTLTVGAQPWMADSYTQGNNLDIELEVLDGTNKRLAFESPDKSQSCQVAVALPASGKYYLALRGVGSPGAYSDYGSLGQYNLQAEFVQGQATGSDSTSSTITTTKSTTKATSTTNKGDNDTFTSSTVTSTTYSMLIVMTALSILAL